MAVQGTCLYGFGAGRGAVRCVTVNAACSRVAAAGDDGTLCLLQYD